MKSIKFNKIPYEHSGVAHVQQKFTDRNRLAHVEQKFTDLALAQRSSPCVIEIHRPTQNSTRGTVLTAPGYTYPEHQNPTIVESNYRKQQSTGEPHKRSKMRLP
jgi:hypothetical protein